MCGAFLRVSDGTRTRDHLDHNQELDGLLTHGRLARMEPVPSGQLLTAEEVGAAAPGEDLLGV
jgi:hypothetical protein